MAKNKKLYITIGILLFILAVIIIYKKVKSKKALSPSSEPSATTPTSTSTSASNSTTTGGTKLLGNDHFPLQIGSQGQRVKYIQWAVNTYAHKKAINILPLKEDGVFGDLTYKGLLLTFGTYAKPPIDIQTYTDILNKANSL